MTAAYRLKSLGWFAGIAVVSIGFYLVSMQVAGERKRLAQVDAKIQSAARDIRALETEFDVRANLAQLERWNGDTLALVAPAASQFVRDEGRLAAISFTPGGAAMGGDGGEVRTAQLIIPSRPNPTAPVAIDEAPVATAAPAATLVQVAVKPAVAKPAAARPIVAAVALIPAGEKPVVTLRKARAVAMLDKALLSDTTLGDLLSGARAEGGRLR